MLKTIIGKLKKKKKKTMTWTLMWLNWSVYYASIFRNRTWFRSNAFNILDPVRW